MEREREGIRSIEKHRWCRVKGYFNVQVWLSQLQQKRRSAFDHLFWLRLIHKEGTQRTGPSLVAHITYLLTAALHSVRCHGRNISDEFLRSGSEELLLLTWQEYRRIFFYFIYSFTSIFLESLSLYVEMDVFFFFCWAMTKDSSEWIPYSEWCHLIQVEWNRIDIPRKKEMRWIFWP